MQKKILTTVIPKAIVVAPRSRTTAMPKAIRITPKIIIDSLENSEYKWRTSTGIAKELGIKEIIIESELKNLNNIGSIVVGRNRDDNKIYSTIKKYKNEKFVAKLIDTSRGEIIR